jgi:basic membrane protein A
MDGYALGADYYNAQYGTSVEVLGWDPDLQTGLFTFDFSNPAAGQAMTSDLYDLGADTVFPVAGVTGFGALDEAALRKAGGETVRVIGVDYDWYEAFGDPDRVILTSVVKNYGPAVFNQIEALVNGTWHSGFVVEGLESGSVDIAKFHKLKRDVPAFIRKDLKGIREGIIDGSIPTIP